MKRSVQYSHMRKAADQLATRYGDWWQYSGWQNEFYRKLAAYWWDKYDDYTNKAIKEIADGR